MQSNGSAYSKQLDIHRQMMKEIVEQGDSQSFCYHEYIVNEEK